MRHYIIDQLRIEVDKGKLPHHRLNRVLDYLYAHLDKDISFEQLAAEANYSPYHFARLFKQTTGESPHQYLTRLRIEKAQRLLLLRSIQRLFSF